MEELIRLFVEEFQQPSTLEETKIANLLGHSDRFIALDQYRRKNPKAQKQILEELAGKLDSMDLYKGCCCAFFCGVLMGECGPDTIPCVEQMPVVLICPEKFPRSWDLFFAVSCHPYLKPLAEIKRELSKEEVREWMGKIKGTR